MNGPIKLGTCHFDLFAKDDKPTRADYTVNVLDERVSNESLLTRTWPQFIEHNIGKIDAAQRNAITAELPALVADFEVGKELRIPSAPTVGEKMAARFTDDLFLGRRMYINNHYIDYAHSASSNLASVGVAFRYVATWTFGLALTRLNKDAAKELKFFVAYGFAKWRRNGYPGLITAFEPTWDFSNISGMVKEWNAWHPE